MPPPPPDFDPRRERDAHEFQTEKSEALRTLAGDIAHDFNNLLTGIIGYQELAADMLAADHPARASLDEARKAALLARERVGQILVFGRPAGRVGHGPVDLPSLVDGAHRTLRNTLPENVALECACTGNLGELLGDASQLHELLVELGTNAGHAMRPNGGVLKITLEPAGDLATLERDLGPLAAGRYLRLTVSDTGHGMSEETRRRIFDPFFTTKPTPRSKGLGLAVMHGIVRSHEGSITVRSTLGRGTTFHVYLPATGDAAPPPLVSSKENTRPARQPTAQTTVCLVDDEVAIGNFAKIVLESLGYRVLSFTSANDCLAQLTADPKGCAVLLADQTMPEMKGTELAAQSRLLVPNLPVVITTGNAATVLDGTSEMIGRFELLTKPFTSAQLAQAVQRALQSGSGA